MGDFMGINGSLAVTVVTGSLSPPLQRAANMIPAHDSPLAALAFDASGTKLATASEKVRWPRGNPESHPLVHLAHTAQSPEWCLSPPVTAWPT